MSQSSLLLILGLLALVWRLKPWIGRNPTSLQQEDLVSIIVPCRNEAHNIKTIGDSLKRLDYPNLEIILVDDSSTDGTREAAEAEGLPIVKAPTKPSGWSGKNWACWQGAQNAKGRYLLFTDADTLHRPDSTSKAVSFLHSTQSDLITAPPFHRCRFKWEKVLGFFCLIPLLITNYRGIPRPKRLFAIGQYLLFKREAYFQIGGHKQIADSLADDLALARMSQNLGLTFRVYPWPDLYSVQMYDSFREFAAGWTRIFRLGLKTSSIWIPFELTLIFMTLLSLWSGTIEGLVIGFLSHTVLAWDLRNHGNFSILSIIFVPASVTLFTLFSLRAVFETTLGRKVVWQGRSY